VVLTGKFSHVNGFRMNGDQFDGSQQTFPKLLQNAGYNTAVIGKWHLHGLPQGFDYWKILTDQGNYYNPDFISINETTKVADTARIEGYATDIITQDGITYLNSVKDSDKPFMLMLQYAAPGTQFNVYADGVYIGDTPLGPFTYMKIILSVLSLEVLLMVQVMA
jgi:uncharacterized sulfatase